MRCADISQYEEVNMTDDYFETIQKVQEILSREYNLPKSPDINLEIIESPLIEQNDILKKTLEVVARNLELTIEEKKKATAESKRNLIIAIASILVAILIAVLGFIF